MSGKEIYRGDILIVDLEPVVGSEQGGIRSVLVIQNNLSNKNSPVIIVTSITSKIYSKEFPTNVFLSSEESGLKKDSTVLLNQIKTIDKRRIIKKISSLDKMIMMKVDRAIKISLDLD